MSFLGAYKAKYEYSNLYKPQYKVAGDGGLVEPDFADANMIDPEVVDIGAKLGEFEQQLHRLRIGGVDEVIDSADAVLHDELLGNRINVVGSGNESASTVEPEVRRIFGEYQIAAMIDSLSDDSDSDYSDDEYGDFAGGDEIDDNGDNNIDNTTDTNVEKTYQGITYYEVNNGPKQDDLTGVNIENVVGEPKGEPKGEPISESKEVVFDINEFLE